MEKMERHIQVFRDLTESAKESAKGMRHFITEYKKIQGVRPLHKNKKHKPMIKKMRKR